MTKTPTLRKSSLQAVMVMSLTALSRLLGFIRISVIAAFYGASYKADVLNAVFNIPNNLRKLMAEGALSSAFIPVLSSSLVSDESGNSSRRIVQNIITFQLIVLIPLMFLSVIFAGPIIRIILDFSSPEQTEMAIELFRWLIHYLLLISVSSVLMGVINTHHRFLIPALTPIWFSVAVIGSIIIFKDRFGIFAVAFGVIAGGIGQLMFQVPLFKKLGYTFKPNLTFSNPAFRQFLKQWFPVVATASIFTINQQIAIFFASGLEEGSVSALSYAVVFWQLPFGIFSASITTVLFPRMSRQSATKDTEGLGETLQYGFRYLIALLIPSAIIFCMMGKEIISVALQAKRFEEWNTILTANVLTGYSIGLLSVGTFSFFQRFFYAQSEYKTPLISAVIVLVLDIVLSLWLKSTSLRVVGLALANTISFTVGAGILYFRANRVIRGIPLNKTLLTTGKTLLAMIPLVIYILLFLRITGDWWREGRTLKTLVFLLSGGIISVGVIIMSYFILKVEVVKSIFSRRLKK